MENTVWLGDCLDGIKVYKTKGYPLARAAVFSPPYAGGIRDYGADGQWGQEDNISEYVDKLVELCDEMYGVMTEDSVIFMVLADIYNWSGLNRNGKCGTFGLSPSRTRDHGIKRALMPGFRDGTRIPVSSKLKLAIAEESRWLLRTEIFWGKGNPRPEGSASNHRPAKNIENILVLSKTKQCSYNSSLLPMDYRTDLWMVNLVQGKKGHAAPYPPRLVELCLTAATKPGDIVIDPFLGSGTTAEVAVSMGRKFYGCEIDEKCWPMWSSLQPLAALKPKEDICVVGTGS